MATYLLVMEQDGGCDYTIGCGTRVEVIRAYDGTMPGSMDEALDIVLSHEDYLGMVEVGDAVNDPANYFESGYLSANSDYYHLRSARIIQVACEHRIDLGAYQAESAARIKAAHDRGKEAAERAEFERLQRKFGGE